MKKNVVFLAGVFAAFATCAAQAQAPEVTLTRLDCGSGSNDPRYQWAAVNAFAHYLLGQYDASLSWAREQLYVNPNHLQALAIRAAALAQLGRTAEAVNAAEVLLSNYPGLTVNRHLRNFRWKLPAWRSVPRCDSRRRACLRFRERPASASS